MGSAESEGGVLIEEGRKMEDGGQRWIEAGLRPGTGAASTAESGIDIGAAGVHLHLNDTGNVHAVAPQAETGNGVDWTERETARERESERETGTERETETGRENDSEKETEREREEQR